VFARWKAMNNFITFTALILYCNDHHKGTTHYQIQNNMINTQY
jgi:hypothetical protein